MAARKEILSDLSTKISDGNISDAYRTFEQLPVVDQIAVSISPGVGDVLAAYEVGEFGRRAKTNIQDKDRLGAAGNIALSALSGISLIPLFRFLRGARGVTKSATKAVDAPKTLKPPVEEPLPLAPPKEPKVKLPKVEPFEPKGIKQINYQAGDFEFGSKARKWVNGIEQPNITTLGKKVQKLPVEQWVQRLENAGVPKGELRVLNILDESNSIHPKLIMSADAKKSLSRQNLDDYIARSQRDAIQVRNTPKDLLQNPETRPDFINLDTQGQLNYFVRGSGEYRNTPHHNQSLKYPDGKTGDNAYVFDGTGKYNAIQRLGDLRPRLAPEDFKTIQDDLLELKLDPFSQGKNVFRMQSDFQEEVSKRLRPTQIRTFESAKTNFDSVVKIPRVYQEANKSIKDFISVGPDALITGTQRTDLMNNLKPEFVDALRANDEQAMRKILGDDLYKTFTDTEFGERVPGKFFAPNDDLGGGSVIRVLERDIQNSIVSKGKSIAGYVELTPKNLLQELGIPELDKFAKNNPDFDSVVKEIFKRTKNVEKIKEKIFKGKPTGFVKPEQQKELIKRLKNYNKEVDAVNDLTAIRPTNIDAIIESLNRDVRDLGIDSLSISPRELERITGKPFTDSLDLTPSDIFNLTDRAGNRVYKGIDFDDSNALSKAYFDDIADQGKTFFDAADGVKVLKKATGINQSQYGMKIDPYFDGGNSKYFKLPVRANILDSANKGDDFLFIGNRQAAAENFDTDIVKTYESAQNEIKKVLKELGVSEQGVVKTIKGTGTEFDGTYLKFTDKLKEAIEKQGVNAFKRGGAVEKSSRFNNFVEDVTTKLNKAANKALDENETAQQIKQFLTSPEARLYIETVLKKNEEPITQDFFTQLENDIYKKQIVKTLINDSSADVDYRAVDKNAFQNYDDYASIPISFYGSPIRSAFGNARLRIPKNTTYEDAEIEIFDKYDFGNEYGGDSYIKNLKKIYDGIQNRNPTDIFTGMEYFAERYGRTIYPEKDTAKMLGKEPNFVPVSVKYPVSDLMTKEQWDQYTNKFFSQFDGEKVGDSRKWNIFENPYEEYNNPYEAINPEVMEGIGSISKLAAYLSGADDPYISSNVQMMKPDVLVEKKATGGEVPSERQQAKLSKNKLDEIEAELQDILGFNIYDNLFKGGTLDESYQDYDAAKDFKESFVDKTEKQLRELLKIPYQDQIIDILQSDDPKENLQQRLDVFGTNQIDSALQNLNLPINLKKTQEGIKFDKDIYAGDKFDVDFTGYRPDDGDFTGDIDFRYKDKGRFGNIDIQSTLDEIGDVNTRARYGYRKGPFNVRAQKYPGRDATGDISYTLKDIDVGKNQTIGVKAIVDQLKKAKFNLDYMYENPQTGGFINAGLGLSSMGGPELNIGFGRKL